MTAERKASHSSRDWMEAWDSNGRAVKAVLSKPTSLEESREPTLRVRDAVSGTCDACQ